jgi:xylulokinase
MVALLGLDIGTQSAKAVVTDAALVPRGEAAAAYKPRFPQPGWAEQDPADWTRALGPAIAGALAQAGMAPGAITAIGVVGQLDGCVAVDRAGRPLAPALLWMDRRAEALLRPIRLDDLRRRTGIIPDASHMAAKILWLRASLGAAARRFHQPVSYVVERLTGARVMDHALASTTMLYDLAARGFAADLLDRFEIEPGALPAVADCGAVAGTLSDEGAALTGLAPGIRVAVGTGDDFAGPLGAGIVAPGRLACTLGTAEVVGALAADPLIDDEDLVETHAFPSGDFFIENPGWFSGGAVDWFVETFRLDGPSMLDRLAAASPPGAEGALFLPTMMGALAPQWIAAARGAYYGFTPSHGTGHLARATLEGCAFAMRDVRDRLARMGVPVQAIRLLGGGAGSAVWAQIRADIAELPVEIAANAAATALGGAVIAAVAAGWQPDLRSAGRMVDRVARIIEPDRGRAALYAERYQGYRRLFAALTPIFGSA